MSNDKRLQKFAILVFLCVAPAVFIAPAAATAQADVAEVPLNAHAKRYGSVWECDWGYLRHESHRSHDQPREHDRSRGRSGHHAV